MRNKQSGRYRRHRPRDRGDRSSLARPGAGATRPRPPAADPLCPDRLGDGRVRCESRLRVGHCAAESRNQRRTLGRRTDRLGKSGVPERRRGRRSSALAKRTTSTARRRGPDPAGGTPPPLVGEFVDMVIEGVSPDHRFRAPRAALQPGDHVWAATDGCVVSIVSMHVLQHADDEVFFTAALRGGQAVNTGGLQRATEAMRVPTETDPVR